MGKPQLNINLGLVQVTKCRETPAAALQEHRPHFAEQGQRLAQTAGHEIKVGFVVPRLGMQVPQSEPGRQALALLVHFFRFGEAVEKAISNSKVVVDLRKTALIADLPEQICRFGVIAQSLLSVVQTLVNQSKIGGKLRLSRQVLVLAEKPGSFMTNHESFA